MKMIYISAHFQTLFLIYFDVSWTVYVENLFKKIKTGFIEIVRYILQCDHQNFASSIVALALLKIYHFGVCFMTRHIIRYIIFHKHFAGVADGVGGWRNYGIDPSAFSTSLMRVCERLVHNGHFKPQSPANLIRDSYQELLAQKYPLIGMLHCLHFLKCFSQNTREFAI